ncbi:MAG: hypothetical protein CMK98_13785 [Pseudomonas sp.]|nr:hypothetical protein [Pseudomonas sp.]
MIRLAPHLSNPTDGALLTFAMKHPDTRRMEVWLSSENVAALIDGGHRPVRVGAVLCGESRPVVTWWLLVLFGFYMWMVGASYREMRGQLSVRGITGPARFWWSQACSLLWPLTVGFGLAVLVRRAAAERDWRIS